MQIDTEREWPTDGPIPMDPESNWDICPVCRADMETLEWISVGLMRSRHNAHKRAEGSGDGQSHSEVTADPSEPAPSSIGPDT